MQPTVGPPIRSAALAVGLLTAMNLLNFIDRYAPSAVKELFKADLKLTDEQTGLIFSAFVVVYMVACPVFGSLAERGRRPRLLAFGIAVWSLATVAGAFAQGFTGLVIARALVGIGEAAFITIAPTLIADLYPPARRNKVLTLLNASTPIGVAIGFSLAGLFGQLWGWRTAFVIVGLPGLALAVAALWLPDPRRGAQDPGGPTTTPPPRWSTVIGEIARNPRFIAATLGYIAMSFTLGGIGDWFPTFLSRERGFSIAEAGSVAGLSIVVGGLVGTVLGGWFAELLGKHVREPLFWVCGASSVPGLVLAGWAIFYADGKLEVTVALTCAQIFLWMYNGPVNALLVNALHAGLRARAFGVALLLTHVLGDVISPPIIGRVSERTGSVATGIGVALLALVVSAVAWMGGALVLSARARRAEQPAA